MFFIIIFIYYRCLLVCKYIYIYVLMFIWIFYINYIFSRYVYLNYYVYIYIYSYFVRHIYELLLVFLSLSSDFLLYYNVIDCLIFWTIFVLLYCIFGIIVYILFSWNHIMLSYIIWFCLYVFAIISYVSFLKQYVFSI